MANVLGELFGNIASAIREKTGDAGKIKPAEFPEKISGISSGTDVSGVTATAADVLEGKTIVDASGNEVEGSIPDNGAVSTNLNLAKRSLVIPKGYHNGDGIIKVSCISKTAVPSKTGQNIRDHYSETQAFLTNVYVEPIPDKYQDVSGVTASAADVRSGRVFVDAEGNEIVGTLVYDVLEPGEMILFEKQNVTGFVRDETYGAYSPGYVQPPAFVLKEGETYRVNWDGEDYSCVAFVVALSGFTTVAIGNASSIGFQGNNEPFLIVYNYAYDNTQIFSTEEDEVHEIGIYTEAPVDVTVSKDEVWAGTGTSNSLAGSGIIRYVTFMNHDGTVEYGKKSVIKGENCVDPVTGGFLDTPTRESTPQYDYTYMGWATEPNGGINSNALKTVTEDRTVYANFASVLRYYTVTFYDEDGITVLAAESYTYNAVPDYTPTKVGYTFDGWTTEILPVTEDTSYVATWVSKVDFSNLTWAQIATYSKAGDADKYIDLGAEKTFTTVSGQTVTAKVIGFNHDDLADGTGKAGITLEMTLSASIKAVNGSASVWYSSGAVAYAKKIWWANSDLRGYWNGTNSNINLLNDIPSDLKTVVKKVRKVAYNTYEGVMGYSDDYFWLPSYTELGFPAGGSIRNEGECYAMYTPDKQDLTAYSDLIKSNNGTAVKYYTRSKMSATTVGSVDATGMKSTYTLGTDNIYGFPCFCI